MEAKIIDLMKSCKHVNEYDQRSALGIADSFVRGSNISPMEIKLDENGVG